MSLVEMNVAAGILIIAIIIIRVLFLNDLPKSTFLILWGVVVLRLLFPFSFNATYSLNTFLLGRLQPSVDEFSNLAYIFSSQELSTTDSQMSLFSAIEMDSNLQNIVSTHDLEIVSVPLINWFLVIWLLGMMICVILFVSSYLNFYGKIKCALPVEPDFFDHWKGKQTLRRSLQILVSDRITTPLTIGIFNPKIILPKGMDSQDESQLAYVLAHEFHHIKRFDALWKLLAVGVACLHWFNPLVWVAFILVNRDLEITCDAWVVKKFGKHAKKKYAYALISMVEYQNEFTPFHSPFARHAIQERLESLVKTKKITRLSIGLASVLVGLLTFHAFSGAVVAHDETAYGEFLTELEPEVEMVDNVEDHWDSAAIYASLIPVRNGDVTFKMGDFDLNGTSREQFFFEGQEAWLAKIRESNEYLSAEEAALIVADKFYERFDVSVDDTLFDIFLSPYDLNRGEENNRVMWSGFIVMPDYLIDRDWSSQILSHFNIFADTGEINFITFPLEEQIYRPNQ